MSNEKIEHELGSEEKLLWSGQPAQGFHLRSSDRFAIPFSILWFGFAAFWTFAAFTDKAPLLFRISGSLFTLAGLYLVAGRFVVDVAKRAHTFYGVTTERIIIITGLFSRQTKSLQLGTLFGLSLTEGRNSSGTIIFGSQTLRVPPGWPFNSSQYAVPAFEMIAHAKETYNLIRQAEKSAKKDAA
jgi:hypothetical protein